LFGSEASLALTAGNCHNMPKSAAPIAALPPIVAPRNRRRDNEFAFMAFSLREFCDTADRRRVRYLNAPCHSNPAALKN
jgi:hypothetical protein